MVIDKTLKVFLSADLGQDFSQDILQFPLIEGIRCNTGFPLKESKLNSLKTFQTEISPIDAWIDLKCRELRLVKAATLPYDVLEINHHFEVKTPTRLYYNGGRDFVIIEEIIEENKIFVKIPDNFTGTEEIKFGKGASFNIPDPSLEIYEYLTAIDLEYIEAAKKLGLHKFLLSYVESTEDINSLLELDPKAIILAKIESKKGLEFVKNEYKDVKNKVHLVAAREDLYIELNRPHEILKSLILIIEKDANAIAASRLMESFLKLEKIPQCSDFTDLGYLIELGYKSFLLGDDLCCNKDALSSALGVLNILNDG